MSISHSLRSKDLMQIHQLLGECRELGDNAPTWRGHLLRKLCEIVDAGLIVSGEMSGLLAGKIRGIGVVAYGFENGFNINSWIESNRRLAEEPEKCLTLQRYVSRYRVNRSASCNRADLVRDHEWYRSSEYQDIGVVMGVSDAIHSFAPVNGMSDDHTGLVTYRSRHRRPFNEREKKLVQYLQQELAKMLGGDLARFIEPIPSDLPPRPRAVLKLILEGEGDKQISQKLGISTHTVNQYVKVVFHHFNVQSRAELMARWIRRGWKSHANWLIDDDALFGAFGKNQWS